MKCPKCSGLLLPEGSVHRCVNCGNQLDRTGKKAPVPIPEEGAPMPATPGKKGWSPERRARFQATMAAKRGGNGKGTPAPVSNGHADAHTSVQADCTVPGATWSEWRRSILLQFDQAIGQLEEQLAKTRKAREAVEAL